MKEIKKCKTMEQLKKKVEEFNLSKKELMNIAYNGNTKSVDSAIPKEYWSGETFWLVMDFQNNGPFGKLVHLGQKILNDNCKPKQYKNSEEAVKKIAKEFPEFNFTVQFKAGQWEAYTKNKDMLITVWHNPVMKFGIVMTHRETAEQIMKGQQSEKQIEFYLKDYENIKKLLS